MAADEVPGREIEAGGAVMAQVIPLTDTVPLFQAQPVVVGQYMGRGLGESAAAIQGGFLHDPAIQMESGWIPGHGNDTWQG